MVYDAQDGRSQQQGPAPVPWQMHLLIGFVGIIIIGIVCYGFYTGDYLNRVNAPLIDAAMEIKYETTTARLLMEEILDGDISIDVEDLWDHFDECLWYVEAMLTGGQNREGTFIPIKNERIRGMVESLKQELIVLRENTTRIFADCNEAKVRPKAMDQYDAAFRAFIAHADEIEDGIHAVMARDLRTFRLTQGALIVICLAMLSALWILFHRFDRLRAQHVSALNDANVSLEREIGERKHVETALEQERDRAQRYLDIAGVILVVIDSDLRITMLNKKGCEVLECLPEDVIGEDWVDNFVPSEKQSEVRWELERTLQGHIEPIAYIENPVTTRKGKHRLFGWHTTVLRDSDGSIVGVLGSGQDITERKLAEEALKAKEENYRTIFN